MNKEEFALFASALRTYYPREQLLPNNQAMDLWYQELCDIPFKIAEAALRRWVAINKWAPTIADVREMAATVSLGDIPEWGEGWKQVLWAIRKIGMYRSSEALETFDPITRECVERLGFRNLCLSEDINSDRANFRMIYENIAERKKKESQISLQVNQMIEGIRKDQLRIEGKESI